MPILTIGECRPRKFKIFSWLVMAIEKADHSHSFVTYKDARLSDIRYVAEARGGGCRSISNHHFRSEALMVRLYEYEVSQGVLDDIHRKIHHLLAKPYGFKQILGLMYIRLLGCLGIKVSNPFKDGSYSQICVELSAMALYDAINRPMPKNVEDYGIREMHELNSKYGRLVPQEKIDRINRVKTS